MPAGEASGIYLAFLAHAFAPFAVKAFHRKGRKAVAKIAKKGCFRYFFGAFAASASSFKYAALSVPFAFARSISVG